MKNRRVAVIVAVIVTAAGFASLAGPASSAGAPPTTRPAFIWPDGSAANSPQPATPSNPPLPNWIGPDGAVDFTKVPRLAVVGQDGKPKKDSKGNPETIELRRPPTAKPPGA